MEVKIQGLQLRQTTNKLGVEIKKVGIMLKQKPMNQMESVH